MPHERVRPDWWMGVNGAEPKLPKTRNEGQKVSNFDVFVLEEIFWNWRHNGFFNTCELDPYISQGQSPTLQLMKRWNTQKAEWYGKPREPPIKPHMSKSYRDCWSKYQDYVEKGGDPTVHDDFNAKHPPTGNGCETCAARVCSIPRSKAAIALNFSR
jgi:hypothetical protein